MRAWALCFMVLASVPAHGQAVSPLNPGAIDTAQFATKAETQAAKTAADAAAGIAATACRPSATVPPVEVVGGSAGTGDTCRLANAIQPRISRTVSGTTATGGTAVVAWPAMSSMPRIVVTPYVASNASQSPLCFPVAGTVTTTGATIKCFTSQSVTVSVLGAVVAPVTTAAAGVVFDVLALPAS